MAPPSYNDLGKACRDVFNKGYTIGAFRLSTNQTTCGGLDVKSDVAHTFEDSAFTGSLETKYKFPAYGLTCLNRWYSNNFLFTGVDCQDKIAPGAKVAVEVMWAPETGEKSGTIIGQYKMDNATADVDMNMDEKSSNIVANGSLVLGYEGWLAGAKGQLDQGEGGLKSNSISFAHSMADVQIVLACDNLDTYKASIYHRVTNRLESGIEYGCSTSGEASKSFGISGRYLTSPCSSIRAKFNNESKLGLGYESQVRPGVTLTVCGDIDLKTFSEGGHKIGLSLEFEQ